MYVRSFQACFCIVAPDRNPLPPLLISGSMCAGSVGWTLKWAHRCTSNKISHTLPFCQEDEKTAGKKKKSFSLHPDRVHSDHLLFQICGSAASVFTSIRNLSGSVVCAFSKNGGIQVLLWPRAANCLMYRTLQALRRFRRLHLCLTDCEQSWLFRKVVCMEGDSCFTEVIHCYQSTIMETGT